jgi:Flp pilus assembly pilin Flp
MAEYILIVTVIALVVIVAAFLFGDAVFGLFDTAQKSVP